MRATGTIFGPLPGWKTCWGNGLGCWIGSSVTWSCGSTWSQRGSISD